MRAAGRIFAGKSFVPPKEMAILPRLVHVAAFRRASYIPGFFVTVRQFFSSGYGPVLVTVSPPYRVYELFSRSGYPAITVDLGVFVTPVLFFGCHQIAFPSPLPTVNVAYSSSGNVVVDHKGTDGDYLVWGHRVNHGQVFVHVSLFYFKENGLLPWGEKGGTDGGSLE